MLSQSKTRRLLTLACFALIVCVQTAVAGRKLHVIVAVDESDASIGKYCRTDGQGVSTVFRNNVHRDELQIHQVPASGLNVSGITATLQAAMIRPQDAVVFYYSGHGSYARDGKPYLVAGGNWTDRGAVTAALQGRGAGLSVMMTDACFNFTDITPPSGTTNRYTVGIKPTSPLFRKLFFETNGFVDLNSCQRDEKAATHADHTLGSVFTKAFVDTLKAKANVGTVTWQSIVNEVSTETASQFALLHPDGETIETGTGDFLNQRSQTVAALAMNVFAHDPGPAPGPTPDPNIPLESGELQLAINARSGRTTATAITYKYFPATGQTQTLRGPTKSLGKASLVRASDNTPFWRWPRVKKPDVVQGIPTYVQAILTDDDASSAGKPVPGDGGGARTFSASRIGLIVSNNGGNGVKIRTVVQGGPAHKCRGTDGRIWRLEPGDTVTQVNGQIIGSGKQFTRAVKSSPTVASIIVVGIDGVTHNMTTTLNAATPGGGPNPMPVPGNGPRFGVAINYTPGMGAVITQVVPGTPATKCYYQGKKYQLEVGDQITHVNGRKITSETAFANAIRSSLKKMTLRVADPSKGTTYKFTTTLNY